MSRILLTPVKIGLMKPPGKHEKPNQIDVYDLGQRGLALRISYGGTKTFFVSARVLKRSKWKPTRVPLGRYPELTLETARDKAHEMLKLIKQGFDPVQLKKLKRQGLEAASVHTFARVRDQFLEACRLGRASSRRKQVRPTTLKEYARLLRGNDFKEWESQHLALITDSEVDALLDGILDRGKRVMANRTHSVLLLLFKFAKKKKWIPVNPMLDVDRPTHESPRDRHLSDEEIKAVWIGLDAAPVASPMKLLLKLILVTGQRPGDVRLMTISNLDFEKKVLAISGEAYKTGIGHVVPLSGLALRLINAALEMRGHLDGAYVFQTKGGGPFKKEQLSKSVKKCFKKRLFDMPPWTPHDLRRTCRTHLAELGVPYHLAERIMGHSQGKMDATYNRHTYQTEQRAALEKWADRLTVIVSKNKDVSKITIIQSKEG